MATVKIWKVCYTPEIAFGYIQRNKVEVTEIEAVHDVFAYAERDKDSGETVYKTISTGIGCEPETAGQISEIYRQSALINHKEKKKTKHGNEIVAWHCEQSFEESPEVLSPQKAHEIGVQFAGEMFAGFPCVVSTHCNTEHVHNHFVFGAYNAEGKKYHQNNKQYQRMRECSDRLCEENGLSVLEETRKQKLVRYRDSNGRLHYYEPTKRKDSLERGSYLDNDYRNSGAYKKSERMKKSNRKSVKDDIDELLPVVKDYDDLVFSLRNLGYEVKDRKRDGSYVKHVSFRAPGQQKATRDYMLSDDGFYERENLEKVIVRGQNERMSEKELKLDGKDITEAQAKEAVKCAKEIYREMYKSERKDADKLRGLIIINIRMTADELQAITAPKDFIDTSLASRRRFLHAQIDQGFRALEYVERNHIESVRELEEMYKKLGGKGNGKTEEQRAFKGCYSYVRMLKKKKIDEERQKILITGRRRG